MIKRIVDVDENRSAVRQRQELAHKFAGEEEEAAVIKVDLDLEFRLKFFSDPLRKRNRLVGCRPRSANRFERLINAAVVPELLPCFGQV